MIELVKYIVKELVDKPELVSVSSHMEGDTEVLTVTVDPTDTGKVIGKQGRIVTALRTVVKAVGIKKGSYYSVEIADKQD